MSKKISTELIEKTKKWLHLLGGIKFFKDVKKEHGQINALWMEKYGNLEIPHPVHFREGMDVRNFMRGSGECKNWTAHEFDDNWIALVEECIK